MRTFIVASLLLMAMAGPAAAASPHYLVKDTVGNCSMLPNKPTSDPGMTIVGSQSGYPSAAAASKALRGLSGCSSILE